MKVATIFGTRPEIIRLSMVIERLDRFSEHLLIHTGQNYDPALSDVFFNELGVRAPDLHLAVRGSSFAMQTAQIIERVGEALAREKPDRVLVLGDTNSALAAIVAARMRIPVYHMEAGNRCFDDRVPEEVNRRIIDHASDILMPYTHRSKENLIAEGISRDRIFVVGNPIYEVLQRQMGAIDRSPVLSNLDVQRGAYLLVTLHRAENVDDVGRLARFLQAFDRVAEEEKLPMIVSVHPRTRDKLQRGGLRPKSPLVRLVEPFGFHDFVKLEKHARCVLTDSGTVQEECCIFGVPNVTLRDVTERAETAEVGGNILSGSDPAAIARAMRVATGLPAAWRPPSEYLDPHVSTAVTKVVLGHLERQWG